MNTHLVRAQASEVDERVGQVVAGGDRVAGVGHHAVGELKRRLLRVPVEGIGGWLFECRRMGACSGRCVPVEGTGVGDLG